MNNVDTAHEAHTVIAREEVVANVDRPPVISWGGIIAGLFFVVSGSWLLHLLGTAIGVSIADASDAEAVGQGFAVGAMIWVLLSAAIVYFVGSLLAARLSGKVDSTAGMLHGLGVMEHGDDDPARAGLSGRGRADAIRRVFNLRRRVGRWGCRLGDHLGRHECWSNRLRSASQVQLSDNIRARLKRRASSVLARMESEGGPDVTQEDIRAAIDSLSDEDLQDIASHIVAGEMTAARETLAEATNLSNAEVREIVSGVETEFEEQLGADDNNADMPADVAKYVATSRVGLYCLADERGGPEVTQQDVRTAMSELTPETLQTVAMRLVNGDVQGAKDALTSNTSLTRRQINDVVDGVNDDVSRTVARYRQSAEEAAEAASTYAQAVLWSMFVASAAGLAVSMLGGWLGAETSRRLEIEVHRDVPAIG